MGNNVYYEKLVNDVTEAINQLKLVIFIGAGVSIAQGYPNWNNYIEHLIKYWQGQVLSESGEKKLGREHHLIFDLISKSYISNKRKVDLVNYELKKIFGEDFEKRRLDFEKSYFKNLLPYSMVNQTVESLASLNAIFITSNYDYEIENHIKRLKNSVVTINDLNEFTKNKNGKLQFGDVLHIHGTPDCDVQYFVSSSADYSKTYLRDRDNFENLVTWFRETEPTVLFIGAGLEEDEILSLLCEDSKNYALMKSENTGNQRADEHYRDVFEEFFSSENHTQIIWYGDKFEDLPTFVKKLVADINEKLGTHEFYNKWNILLNPLLNQEDYNKNLNSISNDFKYLSSLLDKIIENDNDDLSQLLLNGLLQGETLKTIESKSFPIFWTFIVKNIEKLSDNNWKTIYEIISKGNQSYFIDDLYIIYKKAKEGKIFDSKQLNELRKIIAKDSNVINSSFNQDKTLLGYWLVNTFEQQKMYLYIEDEIKIEINLVPECIERLIEIFNTSSLFRYYTLKEILEHNNIELLYKLIKLKRLFVEGKDFLEAVPENLLRTRLVQRFDSNDRQFFEYHIKQQSTNKDIFEKLLSIDVNKLSTLRDDDEQLDMFHYINSDLGLYLQCLISLFDNHSNYKPGIIQKIDSIEDPEYKELSQGILLNEYDPKTINVTYHTFLGFSYSHKVIYAKVANIFKGVVKNILKEKIKDNQILDRVYLVALESVDPTIDSFSLSKNNFSQMINIIFTSEYEFRYSKQWLRELFKYDSSANYLETISNLFYRDNLDKDRLASFINAFNEFISSYNFKLSLYRIKNILNQENTKHFDLIKKYFFVLLENDKLENDIFYLDGIKSILPLLSLDERMNVLHHIQKQSNCPPPEIEELQRIIVN